METGNDILDQQIQEARAQYRAQVPNVVPMIEEIRITRTTWLKSLKDGDVVCRMLGGKIPSLHKIKVIAGDYIFTESELIFERSSGVEHSELMNWNSKDYSISYIQHYTPAMVGKSQQERNVDYVLVEDLQPGILKKVNESDIAKYTN